MNQNLPKYKGCPPPPPQKRVVLYDDKGNVIQRQLPKMPLRPVSEPRNYNSTNLTWFYMLLAAVLLMVLILMP